VTGLRGALKHVTDRVVAGALLVLLLPLLLGIGAVVRLTSPGAALFRHTRVGAGGRPFTMLKFRTMRDGAHAIRDELLDSNEHDGLMFKLRDDPRITPVGRVLRRLSVDELPQLVNVLCGQMSLVGPRPPLPDEVAAYNQVEGRRLLVRPGMTGLWQVNGRSDLTWEETLRLDLRYVDNWSLGLDARLLWRTGRAVIRGTGAY
jgi:lipopolysaccharide/colanic/teichoic acid biosynthesis glycosyltransferase